MAACPVAITRAISRRRPIALTQRRIEANRRNAARSSGPRTPEGKARVARNAVKHGFFVAQDRWTSQQHRDFEEILTGLRDEFKPQSRLEESCVSAMAESYIRMAAMLRYENIAALKYHQQRDREMNERVAATDATEAVRPRAEREQLRRAGLWQPTIPGPREARAIIRYSGSLDRTIHRAASQLEGLKNMRIGGTSSRSNTQKQTHYSTRSMTAKVQKQTHFAASPRRVRRLGEGPQMATSSAHENAKTNPLSSMFMGNRHERRHAKALARRRR